MDDQAAPFARLIRSPSNLGGSAGGGDSGDGEEDEVGRTATGRGSHPVWHDRPSIVGPNSSTGNIHFTLQVWDADVWGHHTFLGVTNELQVSPLSTHMYMHEHGNGNGGTDLEEELVIVGLDQMTLPPVEPPKPYVEPLILLFPKLELMFGMLVYYGFCQGE